MKCPKCEYLGFDTGDRCKNCGYDFSLAAIPPEGSDLMLREPETPQRDADRWLTQLEARLDSVRPAAAAAPAADPLGPMALDAPVAAPPLPPSRAPGEPPPVVPQIRTLSKSTPALPLFHPGGTDWDEPLIKVPSAPRPPLAVRRTPDRPKLRTAPKASRRISPGADPAGVLEFTEEPASRVGLRPSPRQEPRVESPAPAARGATDISGAGRRIFAAVVDQLILLSIDVVVIYFTFRIAGMPFTEWQAVPMLPLVLFLLMVKASYFSVFTALGGQTVGKMTVGIRVVGEDDRDVNPSRAVQRTLAALASVATVGLGFAPVLLGGDRRALHDRVAGTRVVGPAHE
jgi:uncharacterized RDD family membrane protein YckC